MNSVIVIICAYLLGNTLEGVYVQEYYFKSLGEVDSNWSVATVLYYVVLIVAILLAIIKEKHEGLKLVQIGIVIFFLVFSCSRAISTVQHFETNPTRFYEYSE
jgi:hypothetical protein